MRDRKSNSRTARKGVEDARRERRAVGPPPEAVRQRSFVRTAVLANGLWRILDFEFLLAPRPAKQTMKNPRSPRVSYVLNPHRSVTNRGESDRFSLNHTEPSGAKAHRMPSAFTVRLEDETVDALDRLAETDQRSRNWLVAKAIEDYVALNAWQIGKIEAGIAAADRNAFADERNSHGCGASIRRRR